MGCKHGGDHLKRFISIVLLALILATRPATADMYGAEYKECNDKDSTFAISECVQAKTKAWDQKLNAAYKALQQHIAPGQQEPLKAAERLWLQYRAANCNFYGSAEGSIRELEGAECMRAMTEDRAKELAAAAHE